MSEDNEETVTIPKSEYESLLRRALFLQRLEDAGVDNWEYYYLGFGEDEDED